MSSMAGTELVTPVGIAIYSGTIPANVVTSPSAPATHLPLAFFPANATPGYSTFTLSGVALAAGPGQFTYSSQSPVAPALAVGMNLTITGTFGGTGSINGYLNAATTYTVSAATSTTFTLVTRSGQLMQSTPGTPTGLTYTVNVPILTFNSIASILALNTGTAAWFRIFTDAITASAGGALSATAATGGVMTLQGTVPVRAYPDVSIGQLAYLTGTIGGTGSITGYASGNVYYISAVTQNGVGTSGSTVPTLQTSSGGAVTSSAGTITGLTWFFGIPFLQGTVGTSGTDMIVTNTSLASGQTCAFASMAITAFGA